MHSFECLGTICLFPHKKQNAAGIPNYFWIIFSQMQKKIDYLWRVTGKGWKEMTEHASTVKEKEIQRIKKWKCDVSFCE